MSAVDDDERGAAKHFPHGRGLAAIVLFWTVFGALSVTNWFFPPVGEGPPLTFRVVAIGAFSSLMWMIATPPLFWLTRRYSVERNERAATIAFYLVIALLVAFAVDALGELVRTTFAPLPPMRAGGPPRGGRLFWGLTRARLLNDYTVCLAIVAAGVARDYFVRYQRRLEESTRLRAQLAEARLTALQSQLNPHFLFNTLNAVSALVERDPKGVRRMIARLSDLLRATLEPSTDPEITVLRELEILEPYLDILRIRFEGRLETSIAVGENAHDALVPPMILQPLVENSMKHAVSKMSGPSRIDLSVDREGENLVLRVRDTGPGASDGEIGRDSGAFAVSGMGIGLRNTRARLGEIYDEAYSLELAPTPEGGAMATIKLPYHTRSDVKATPSVARIVA